MHADHQGSIVAISDGTTSTTMNKFDEYGNPAAGNQGRFGYTGQIWLPELGLWHYKARMYCAECGRFMQVDPVGYESQVSLYAYVGNDPLNLGDPSGLYKCNTESKDCAVAKEAIEDIKAAKNFYNSPETGSRLARSPQAVRALDKVLNTLGKEGEGPITIKTGDLPGKRGLFDPNNNTITLDVQAIKGSGGLLGETLGHEVQHFRQRNEDLNRISTETRPLMMQYMIGTVPGGPIPHTYWRDYVTDRLYSDYCKVPARLCAPLVNEAIREEPKKPF